jgi:sulfane dehydrogenase subunit SoxC
LIRALRPLPEGRSITHSREEQARREDAMSNANSERMEAKAKAIEEALGRLGEPISEAQAKDVVAPEDCDCKDGMFALAATRRQLFGGAGLVAAVGMTAALPHAAAAKAPPGAAEYPVPADSTKEQGRMMGIDGGYGLRSQFESEVRWFNPTRSASFTPMQNGYGIITPSGLHYERHHGGIPTVDPAKHRLVIHGQVDRPIKYSLADLRRFPTVSRTYFMECSGTTGRELMRATEPTVQRSHGLVSTSEWTGVPLSTLLKQSGLKPGAAWVLAEGADAAVMTRSVPIDKCLSDALIVFAQNGEAIRPEQGYPMRLFLPGWEGNISIKWLRRLEVSDQPYYTREETSKYTDLITKTGKARIFTFTMEAKSVITFPSGEMKLPGPGFYEVTGLAWSGRGKIARVEISTDGGKTWSLAALQDPVLPICQTRFRFPWIWDGTATVLQSRATDETGYTQPTHQQLIAERGPLEAPGMMYHMNAIQSWGVAADGSVKNVHPLG